MSQGPRVSPANAHYQTREPRWNCRGTLHAHDLLNLAQLQVIVRIEVVDTGHVGEHRLREGGCNILFVNVLGARIVAEQRDRILPKRLDRSCVVGPIM